MDSKVSLTVAAVSAGVALYTGYKYYCLQCELQQGNVYETEKLKNEYLLLHYGSPTESMLWGFGPRDATEFPKRCAELCFKYRNADAPLKALDVGCAVGRSSFELARTFTEVVGVDFSENFIDTCNTLKDVGNVTYTITTEGTLEDMYVARVDPAVDRSRCEFRRGDACCLPADLTGFGCVLAANLICRLARPEMFLLRCGALVAKGGVLVITSPYTFMTDYTPLEKMIGGVIRNGRSISGFEGLKTLLSPFFELLAEEEMPFLIRETKRKHQWTVTHATVWKRK